MLQRKKNQTNILWEKDNTNEYPGQPNPCRAHVWGSPNLNRVGLSTRHTRSHPTLLSQTESTLLPPCDRALPNPHHGWWFASAGPDWSPTRPTQVQCSAVPRYSVGAEYEANVEELESELADLDRHTLEHLRCTATCLRDTAFSPFTMLCPPARLKAQVWFW